MSKILEKTEFGNPILRKPTRELDKDEILSTDIRELLADMYFTLDQKEYGVGLAAPQIGKSLAVSTIDTKPTPTRPTLTRQKLTLINPEIVERFGNQVPMWEGCISGAELYGQVPRYEKIRIKWLDEQAKAHEQDFDGFMAHVIQHEVDHLNGVLFVDRVKDPKSYITFSEYKKMKAKEVGSALL